MQARNAYLIRTYGITLDDEIAMLEEQGGKCAICRHRVGKGRERHIDHDHATGKVRGVLCLRCNSALALVGESPTVLEAMAAYIEKHRVVSRPRAIDHEGQPA